MNNMNNMDNMDICLTPSIYMPGMDTYGNYVDTKPTFVCVKNSFVGITCPCGSRLNKVYDSPIKFASHIKTQTHIKWIQHLNNNKSNYYLESVKTKEINKTQQQIIVSLENELSNKSNTINYLTKQLTYSQPNNTADLLNINE